MRTAQVAIPLVTMALVVIGAAHANTISTSPMMMSVTETATPTSSGASVQDSVVQSPISNVQGMRHSTSRGGTKLHIATQPWRPWPNSTDFANDKAAEQAIGPFLAGEAGTAAHRVCQLLNRPASHSHTALSTYRENLTINGKPASITGTELVHDDCTYQYLGTHINNQVQRLLYATYSQYSMEQGLPTGPGWNLRHAGELQWEIVQIDTASASPKAQAVSLNGQVWHTRDYVCSSSDPYSDCPDHWNGPIGAWGYYDEPQHISTSSVNGFYHCSLNNSGQCDNFAPTNVAPAQSGGQQVQVNPNVGRNALIRQVVRPLMRQHNAEAAILDYGRTVHPVYNNNGKPITAVDVTSRTFYLKKTTTTQKVWYAHMKGVTTGRRSTVAFFNTKKVGSSLPGSPDNYLINWFNQLHPGAFAARGLSWNRHANPWTIYADYVEVIPPYCTRRCSANYYDFSGYYTAANGPTKTTTRPEKYENKGYYGFLLRYTYDRVMIRQGASGVTQLETQSRTGVSPNKTYDKVVPANHGQNYYWSLIINPFSTKQLYNWNYDYVNGLPPRDYVYVAPLAVVTN